MTSFLFTYLYGFSSNVFINDSAIWINRITYIILAVLFIWSIFFAKRKFFSTALLSLSGLSAWFVAHMLKFIFHTSRPFIEFGFTPLVYESNFSFPSEHAAVFSALAVVMFLINKRLAIALSIIAVLVGLSRVILGVHYPLDVIGGYVVGSVVALLYIKLFRKI